MKSLFSLAFLCMTVVSVAGCGQPENEVLPPPDEAAEQEIENYEAEQDAEMNDPANR